MTEDKDLTRCGTYTVFLSKWNGKGFIEKTGKNSGVFARTITLDDLFK